MLDRFANSNTLDQMDADDRKVAFMNINWAKYGICVLVIQDENSNKKSKWGMGQ